MTLRLCFTKVDTSARLLDNIMKIEIPTKPLTIISVAILLYTMHIVVMDWLRYLG